MNELIDKLIGSVCRHLDEIRRSQDVALRYDHRLNPPAHKAAIAAAEESIQSPVPDDLRQTYMDYADGFKFVWTAQSATSEHGGGLEFPTLKRLVKLRKPFINYWMADGDDDDFRGVADPSIGRKTAERMKSWLPVFCEPNGDQIAIDLSSGKAVFDQHDWMDGGTGANGHPMAANFREFIERWSTVCFTDPLTRWWPDAFTQRGVSWTSRSFDRTFIWTNR